MMRNSVQVALAAIPALFCLACGSGEQQHREEPRIDSLSSPTSQGSAEPHLFADGNGTVYMSWVEKTETGHRFLFSTLDKTNWTEPKQIASDSTWFVNWADYPMLTSDGSGHLLSHVLRKSGTEKFAYDVELFTSADNGSNWQGPLLLNDDNVMGEHGFVSMMPFGDHYLVAWLDGRNTSAEGHDLHNGHHGAMSLRAAVVTREGEKADEWELDDRTCDCCQTAVADPVSGPVVIYRDRSPDEIRDLSIVRLVDGVWTIPTAIHRDGWNIAGCPVNGPRAEALGNTLAVAWFTGAGDTSVVNVAFSANGGQSFDDPIRVDAGKPIGRVDIVLQSSDVAWVTWMEGPVVMIRSIRRDGVLGPPLIVSTSSESRSSGFPQMTRADDGLVLAWTDEHLKTIRTARVIF